MAKRDALGATDTPLYKQLEQSFIADIVAGRLKPGDAVPSTYTLAEQYGISRVTAVRCYAELKGRGFLTARRGGSTTVNPNLVLPGETSRPGPADSFEAWESGGFDNCLAGLSLKPPGELVPGKAWLRTMQSVLEGGLLEFSGDAECLVIPRLKHALAAFLIRTRGMSVYPRNIMLFDSKWHALAFVADHLLEKGDAVAVENPGDPLLQRALERCSPDLRLMDLDREGAVIERLEPKSGVKLIVVSPSAQLPTGVIMSERRRQQLARYAGQNECVILEDDGAALLRYGKQPEPCLFNKYRDALHVGTFGTYLGPLCQLSYLVVPNHLLARMREGDDVKTFCQPRLEHFVVARMIESGAMDQVIFRLRSTLTKRRHELLSLLFTEFSNVLSVNAGVAGYDLVVRFHSRFAREQLLKAIENCGLESRLLEHCYFEKSERQRVELILPLVETGEAAGVHCNVIDRLLAMKRQLLNQVEENFAPVDSIFFQNLPTIICAGQPFTI